jgi:hypothetical protein
MKVGMLWFDNDPKVDITVKINRAIDYYQHKYGQTPNLCFVHPSMVKSSPTKTGLIEVRSSRAVLPNHFWIGLNTSST